MVGDHRTLRTMRLWDLAEYEAVVMKCRSGNIAEYGPGVLQRLHKVPSDTLIFDLQFRLRGGHCNARQDFEISVTDRQGYQQPADRRRDRLITSGQQLAGQCAGWRRIPWSLLSL